MISVEIVSNEIGEQKGIVEIYFDRAGLEDLQSRLRLIVKNGVRPAILQF